MVENEERREIVFSENLICKFESDYERKVLIVAKQCDFCGKRLPKEYISTNCSLCDTIFDECDECKKWPRINPSVCHKSHKQGEKSANFTQKEVESIETAEPFTITVYGSSLQQRLRMHVDGIRLLDTLVLDDAPFLRKNGCELAAEMVEKGYGLEVAQTDDAILLRVKDKPLKRKM